MNLISTKAGGANLIITSTTRVFTRLSLSSSSLSRLPINAQVHHDQANCQVQLFGSYRPTQSPRTAFPGRFPTHRLWTCPDYSTPTLRLKADRSTTRSWTITSLLLVINLEVSDFSSMIFVTTER
jgi:hypothetical protein